MTMFAVLLMFSVLWNLSLANGGGVCHLPADPGPCLGYFPRWFFNMAKMKCEKFIYGGCLGNGNRFKTENDCEAMCKCFLPKDPGSCLAHLKRWYYDKLKKKCKKFFYYGCDGNRNNFMSKKHCKKACYRFRRP